MNKYKLRWRFFRDNVKELRKTMHKLRNQTGEIMLIEVWWLSPSGVPIVFAPWFIDLRTGNVRDKRTDKIVNIREMFKEKYGA